MLVPLKLGHHRNYRIICFKEKSPHGHQAPRGRTGSIFGYGSSFLAKPPISRGSEGLLGGISIRVCIERLIRIEDYGFEGMEYRYDYFNNIMIRLVRSGVKIGGSTDFC
jgi:hypothetical protein